MDAAGDLFIADSGNDRIREVNLATGIISTVAGDGSSLGCLGDGGPATAAVLSDPSTVAVNAAGVLFVADSNDSRIREVTGGTAVTVSPASNASTTTTVAAASGIYGGTASLTATLLAGGAAVPNASIAFSLGGSSVGTATTNADGVATLAGASLAGWSAGTYSGVVTASFAGNSSYAPSIGSAALTVIRATPTVTVVDAGGPYTGSPYAVTNAYVTGIPADGTIAAFGDPSLSYTYYAEPANTAIAGAPTDPGTYAVVGTFSGNRNYVPAASSAVDFTIGEDCAYLAPDPLFPGLMALYVFGTPGNDVILVKPATGPGTVTGDVTVTINNVVMGTFDPTSRIIVHGLSGNDYIGVSSQITLASWLYADTGNDVLWGGGGPDVLVGGSGNSTLWGGAART